MQHRPSACLVLAITLLAASPGYPSGVPGAPVDPAGLAASYGERIGMIFLDRRCDLLEPEQHLAVMAFAAQARSGLLRAGLEPRAIDQVRDQARAHVASLDCNGSDVATEAARVRKAFGGWRGILRAELPGIERGWVLNRSGLDGWRAWQVLDGEDMSPGHVRAGLVRHEGDIRFALETSDSEVAFVRVLLRDRSMLPVRGPQTSVLPPPVAATIPLQAAAKLPAITRLRAGVEPRSGSLLVFDTAATRQIVRADPRDAFALEVTRRDGSVSRHVVEVGDLVVGYVFAAMS